MKTWQLVAVGVVGVVGVGMLARGMSGGSAAGGGGAPEPDAPGGPKDPFEQWRRDPGFQQADKLLGGLLTFSRSATETAGRIAMDQKTQDQVIRITGGGLEMLANAF